MAFGPDGRTFATGGQDGGARLFPSLRPVPDDLDRAAAWVGIVTGLSLDASAGSSRVLDNAEWQALRARLEHLGGPPEVISPARAGSLAPDGKTRSPDFPVAEQSEEASPRMDHSSLEEWLRSLNARWSRPASSR